MKSFVRGILVNQFDEISKIKSSCFYNGFQSLKVTKFHIQEAFFFLSFLQKLYIFLFQDILVLTRPVTRNERHSYQVYRQPIPIQELVLEDLQDGDVRMGGSFRGAFSNSDKGKNTCFKIVSIIINSVLIYKNSVPTQKTKNEMGSIILYLLHSLSWQVLCCQLGTVRYSTCT